MFCLRASSVGITGYWNCAVGQPVPVFWVGTETVRRDAIVAQFIVVPMARRYETVPEQGLYVSKGPIDVALGQADSIGKMRRDASFEP